VHWVQVRVTAYPCGLQGSLTSYLLLVTGFLGSFTTLSAFSIETLRLWQSGYTVSALIYVFATVIGAMTAALLGSLIAQAG